MGADNNRSMMGTLLTWIFTAVLLIVAIKVVFWVLGIALGLGALLLMIALKVLPALLVGWLALKLYRAFFGERRSEEPGAF